MLRYEAVIMGKNIPGVCLPFSFPLLPAEEEYGYLGGDFLFPSVQSSLPTVALSSFPCICPALDKTELVHTQKSCDSRGRKMQAATFVGGKTVASSAPSFRPFTPFPLRKRKDVTR